MLRSMRRNTKIIMLVVVLAFVGLMVFQWGMDISGRSSPQAIGEVGRVNGTGISYQLWTRTYRSLTDQARQQKGSALNDLELDFIVEQAWNELVNQILIEQELRRRGITVTDEEVRLAFQTTPPPWLMESELFQTGGQFDYEKYREFFSGPAVDPLLLMQIEDYYRSVLPRARLMEQISSGIYVSDSELWTLYRRQTETVQVRYIVLDPEIRVEDSEVAMTEDELRAYYYEHLDDFEQPALAEVTLVEFSRVPGPADSAATLETATQVREEILAGADFEEQARTHSGDPASAPLGGDLGWFGRGDMQPAFEAAAFELEPEEISEVLLTGFGYHIIKLVEKDEDRVHASHILFPIRLQGDSEEQLLAAVDRTERIALRSGLGVAVDSVGVASRRISLSEGNDFVLGLGRFPPVQKWAFHDSTAAGDLSPVYETDDGFYFFELVERVPESQLPFADAELAVRRRLMLEKKKETAGWLAEQIGAELRERASLDDVATAHGFVVQASSVFLRGDFEPGLGQNNDVIGTAFGLHLNEVSGPIESDDRFYFIQVVEHNEASREGFDLLREGMRAQLSRQRQQVALDEWLAGLREIADIKDWRQEIFVP